VEEEEQDGDVFIQCGQPDDDDDEDEEEEGTSQSKRRKTKRVRKAAKKAKAKKKEGKKNGGGWDVCRTENSRQRRAFILEVARERLQDLKLAEQTGVYAAKGLYVPKKQDTAGNRW
jgi:hypothetical protein